MRIGAAALLALAAATPAAAQQREFCPERPGLETQACIVDRGRVTVESSLVDWTRDTGGDGTTDTILVADTLVRVGVTDRLELRAGWQPFGHERTRDASGIDLADRVGDAVVGLKASLLHPDGKGLSIAILPSVTLPVGRQPIGAGRAQPSLLLPVSYELSDAVEIGFTPAIRALANEDAGGQHLRYGAAAGVTVKITEAVTVGADASLARDQDPSQHTTRARARAAMTLAWQPQDDWQIDTSAIAGLNHDTPDVQLIAGIARRF